MKTSQSPAFWTDTKQGRKALVLLFDNKTCITYYKDDKEIGTARLTDDQMIELAARLVREARSPVKGITGEWKLEDVDNYDDALFDEQQAEVAEERQAAAKGAEV